MTCINTPTICLPSGDGATIFFDLVDQDGDLFDLTDVDEITFIVCDSFGGTVRIEKKLSDLEIEVEPSLNEFSFNLLRADTAALVNQSNYYECTVSMADGFDYTVAAGLFKAPQTMNKDLA